MYAAQINKVEGLGLRDMVRCLEIKRSMQKSHCNFASKGVGEGGLGVSSGSILGRKLEDLYDLNAFHRASEWRR